MPQWSIGWFLRQWIRRRLGGGLAITAVKGVANDAVAGKPKGAADWPCGLSEGSEFARSKKGRSLMPEVDIFTDGACRGNPGPGGWAALLRSQGVEKMFSGAEPETTNNQMELMAAIQGLEALKRTSSVTLTTDSQYVRQGITQWIHGWKRNGWKTSQKQPVKNKELWQRLDAAVENHDVQWQWVKGHSGHVENERVDQAANEAIDLMQAQS